MKYQKGDKVIFEGEEWIISGTFKENIKLTGRSKVLRDYWIEQGNKVTVVSECELRDAL